MELKAFICAVLMVTSSAFSVRDDNHAAMRIGDKLWQTLEANDSTWTFRRNVAEYKNFCDPCRNECKDPACITIFLSVIVAVGIIILGKCNGLKFDSYNIQ